MSALSPADFLAQNIALREAGDRMTSQLRAVTAELAAIEAQYPNLSEIGGEKYAVFQKLMTTAQAIQKSLLAHQEMHRDFLNHLPDYAFGSSGAPDCAPPPSTCGVDPSCYERKVEGTQGTSAYASSSSSPMRWSSETSSNSIPSAVSAIQPPPFTPPPGNFSTGTNSAARQVSWLNPSSK